MFLIYPSPILKCLIFLSRHLPTQIQLQVSNSSAIRYLQLVDFDSDTEVFCNRGTSGIDGSTSTAIGAAVHHHYPTYFITGDISFFMTVMLSGIIISLKLQNYFD